MSDIMVNEVCLDKRDLDWIKQYCTKKFRTRHSDYDFIYHAITYAYKQGLKAGKLRNLSIQESDQPMRKSVSVGDIDERY